MKHIVAAATFAAAIVFPAAAFALAEGSQQAAGGAHMSSYISDPYHDPKSVWAQSRGTGQILGAPMLSENAGAHNVRRAAPVNPRWSSGTAR
ncbi:hypothetical protein MMB17_08060 [Methylobacterium organophilum]|uniref:hypothetical protein n=1 Tax=Methylobacterium organophilum TaxID=410 RepID=UPI001F130AD1|nr:hypothetical protein [Methylobacterium organophilum]UMY19243.1 hypothetical protein MMB17_08060 [Methylobacterium organophilum]